MNNVKKAIFTLILIAFFLWLFLRNIDVKKTEEILKSTKLFYVYSMFPVYVLIYIFRSLRWKLIIENGYKLSFLNVFSANIIGFAINYSLPARIGEYARAYILGKREKKSVSFIFGTVIIERILDLGAMAFFMVVFFFYRNRFLEKFGGSKASVSVIEDGSIAATSLFVVFVVIFYLVYRFEEKTILIFKKITDCLPKKIGNPIYSFGEKFIDGIVALYRNKNMILILFYSILIWTLVSVSYLIALKDFGLNVGFFDIIPYIIALLAGASVPTPGMVGSFHAASLFALSGLYGVERNIAGAATFTVHFALLIITFVLSIPFVIIESKTIISMKKEIKK